ncbi:MAG: helix-turn-helix transcriptional regulator [Gemmatimonadetes bacterium]|nr:helix-turn-helix transcriptional regulator [Gemmatimonadota bacterium]
METNQPEAQLSPYLQSEFYRALGHTIKVARTDLGIERKALAERAGISYSYLSAIEGGKKQPSSQVLFAIADALGLRSHELLESVEGRQERNLAATEEYPSWLLGRSVGAREAPMAHVAAAAPPPRSPEDRDSFLAEMQELEPSLAASDRRLLLDMAHKLAGMQDRE